MMPIRSRPWALRRRRGRSAVGAIAVLLALVACRGQETSSATAVTPRPPEPSSSAEADDPADAALRARLPDKITGADHAWVMDAILGRPRQPIGEIGILVYDGVNDLDVMGPRYILGQSGARTRLIGVRPGPIRTVMGVQMVPDTVIDEIDRLDILVVPGGFTGTVEAAYDARVLDWIRRIDSHTTYTAAVCTGVWILGASGLLEGRRASTNWYREQEFLTRYKAVPANERYTRDGKYWTSAGVTAGMDMSLAMLQDNWGKRYAQGVMLDMEYDPKPPLEGGSPEKTPWLVRWMLSAMYDAGIDPLIERLEAERSRAAAPGAAR